MKLKNGKKYETADGVVYRVLSMMRDGGKYFEVDPEDRNQWQANGTAMSADTPDLIRRHYKKPQPAHKLDLKPGDVVKLVAWEDGDDLYVGKTLEYDEIEMLVSMPKGHRPLFRVLSRS